MIGIGSFLMRGGMALAFSVIGSLIAYRASRERRYGWILVGLVFAAGGVAMAGQLCFNLAYLVELQRLDAKGLTAVVVGRAAIEDQAALSEISHCLQSSTWFDGRRGTERLFEMRSRHGVRRVWRVAPLGDGAVIDFGLTHGQYGLYRGAAYVDCLPGVLRRHRISLQ